MMSWREGKAAPAIDGFGRRLGDRFALPTGRCFVFRAAAIIAQPDILPGDGQARITTAAASPSADI